jgi:hypothetical protein
MTVFAGKKTKSTDRQKHSALSPPFFLLRSFLPPQPSYLPFNEKAIFSAFLRMKTLIRSTEILVSSFAQTVKTVTDRQPDDGQIQWPKHVVEYLFV